MTEKQKAARAAYMKEYRKKNAEKVRETKRKWDKAHPEKLKEYQERYWEKQADRMIEALQNTVKEG